jgi:hypothetical protein
MSKECKVCKITKEDKEFFTCGTYKNKVYRRRDCIECHNSLRIGKNLEYYKNRNQTLERKLQKKISRSNPEYKEKQRIYENKRYKEDLIYRLKKCLRIRVRMALKAKKWRRDNTLYKYLGCSLDQLKQHLEAQFTEGMTWENYGFGENKWTIDHVIPLSSAQNLEDMYKLCHFNNLQPLWYIENIRKSNNII